MDNNDIVSIVALFVSVIALLGTVAQVLQQYYASAAGYANCNESVIGKWSSSKRRKFRPSELRFEVRFETPVIFVAAPTNTRGPILDEKIYYVQGTPESLQNTRTLLPKQEENRRVQPELKDGVHTADNERATWVTLLSELQLMEQSSMAWEQQKYASGGPRASRPPKFMDHKLAVAVQPKKRSWDTMPSNVKKPYATSTMCHVVEIAAMMGLHWKEFNRSEDKYRAEGNGYTLTGTNVTDLGIMFTFQISGQSRFEENRIIPADEVKEFAFGFAPTIFRDQNEDTRRRLDFPVEEPSDCSVLNLGSMNEIAETLVLIGCNTNTANLIRSDKKKHGHLFPVAFELIGMIGKTLHLRNSCFTMLPNPTPYRWDKKFFNLRKLLSEYNKQLADLPTATEHMTNLGGLADAAVRAIRQAHSERVLSLGLLDALHEALDACDDYLRRKKRQDVLYVLRTHMQVVLSMLNGGEMAASAYYDVDSDDELPPRFEDLNVATPEDKQKKFMQIYFKVILPSVVNQAVELKRARTSTYRGGSASGRHTPQPSESSAGPESAARAGAEASPSPPAIIAFAPSSPGAHQQRSGGDDEGDEEAAPVRPPPRLLHADTGMFPDEQARNIWCTLVLRMLCFLNLHEFHKNDVQISKSELLGSRLPVYIG